MYDDFRKMVINSKVERVNIKLSKATALRKLTWFTYFFAIFFVMVAKIMNDPDLGMTVYFAVPGILLLLYGTDLLYIRRINRLQMEKCRITLLPFEKFKSNFLIKVIIYFAIIGVIILFFAIIG